MVSKLDQVGSKFDFLSQKGGVVVSHLYSLDLWTLEAKGLSKESEVVNDLSINYFSKRKIFSSFVFWLLLVSNFVCFSQFWSVSGSFD